ncbi:MAG: ferritin-like domain-containing protein [Chloroflexi bacterium]|nr:MAG: ferritin-like domain-containing protein [Chloroflexota bacterium]
MPVVDRREFGGRFSVRENAQRLANYRYLEIQLMEMVGGWCHTTPQLALKAGFGYHVYDHAQAADMLGERLEQLRSTHDSQEPGTDEFARLCESVWKLEDTAARLSAVYGVMEPHLVSTYVYHADATDPLADTPTVRLLRHLAAVDQSHVAWGKAMLDSLTRSPEARQRAAAVQMEMEARLLDSGGVTGQGIESHWLAFHSTREADKPQKRTRRSGRIYRFKKQCQPLEHSVVEEPFFFSGDPDDFHLAYSSDDEWSLEGFRHKFHQLLYGEVETTDRMGKMIAEFPDLPWEMRTELAHQMWDEARHIEIVAKACEEELGAKLGYGPWPLAWWWMQNEEDPLRRISVTNGWAEANLMHTLREWREHAEQRGYTRIAELCDYLQADELTHVRLATRWVRKFIQDRPEIKDDLVGWSRKAVDQVQGFYNSAYSASTQPEPRFSFLRGDGNEEEPPSPGASHVIGE